MGLRVALHEMRSGALVDVLGQRPAERSEVSVAVAAPLDCLKSDWTRMTLKPKIRYRGREVAVTLVFNKKRKFEAEKKLASDTTGIAKSFQYVPGVIIQLCCRFLMPGYRCILSDFEQVRTKIPGIKKGESFYKALQTGTELNIPSLLAVWLQLPTKTVHKGDDAPWRKKIQWLPNFDLAGFVQLARVCKAWSAALRPIEGSTIIKDYTCEVYRVNISQFFIRKTIDCLRWKVFFNCFSTEQNIRRLKFIFYLLIKSGRPELTSYFLDHLHMFAKAAIVYLFSKSILTDNDPRALGQPAFSHQLSYDLRLRIGYSHSATENTTILYQFIVEHELYTNSDIIDPELFYQDYTSNIRKELIVLLTLVEEQEEGKAKEFFLNRLAESHPKLHNIVYHAVFYHDHVLLLFLAVNFTEIVKKLAHEKDVRSILKSGESPDYYKEMDQCYCTLFKYNALRSDINANFEFFLDEHLPKLRALIRKKEKIAARKQKKQPARPLSSEYDDDENFEMHVAPVQRGEGGKPARRPRRLKLPAASASFPPPLAVPMRAAAAAAPPSPAIARPLPDVAPIPPPFGFHLPAVAVAAAPPAPAIAYPLSDIAPVHPPFGFHLPTPLDHTLASLMSRVFAMQSPFAVPLPGSYPEADFARFCFSTIAGNSSHPFQLQPSPPVAFSPLFAPSIYGTPHPLLMPMNSAVAYPPFASIAATPPALPEADRKIATEDPNAYF